MKKSKKTKNTRIAVYAVVAVVLIAALYFISNNIQSQDLSTYDFSRQNNPEYYSQLPVMPSNFDEVQLMWTRGIIRDDPDYINSSYWKQPEWFPNYGKTFLPTLEMIAKESNREVIWSLGIFDSQIYRSINQDWLRNPTDVETTGHGEFEVTDDSVILRQRFWLRSAPGSSRIYGVRIMPVFPGETYLQGNSLWGIEEGTISQDADTTQEYFTIRTWESSSEDTQFNLGTYWPILDPEYIKQIEVEVEISKDTPKGIYILGVDAGAPTKQYQETQSLKYGLKYTDPNIGMFRGPSEFRLFVEVI